MKEKFFNVEDIIIFQIIIKNNNEPLTESAIITQLSKEILNRTKKQHNLSYFYREIKLLINQGWLRETHSKPKLITINNIVLNEINKIIKLFVIANQKIKKRKR